MNRTQRLPALQRRVAPGQMTLDGALIKAQRRYPEAVRFEATRTGRVLSVLPGGTSAPAAPAVAMRRAA